MVRPRIMVVPPCDGSRAEEALEFCRSAGLELDEHQELVLSGMLGMDADGRWSAGEVGLTEARQNGKTRIAVAREAYGLFECGERLVVHSSHERPSSFECFLSMVTLVESSEELSRKVKAVRRGAGLEGIDLLDGRRIRYRTRTKGGGRGLAADLVVFDEAHTLSEASMAALVPMLGTRVGQVVYMGTAVDQQIHEHGAVFSLLRERARSGASQRLCYFEWSPVVPLDELGREVGPDALDDDFLDDELNIRAANPAVGAGRLSLEAVALERRALSRRAFAVERLSCGDRPTATTDGDGPISLPRWAELVDPASEASGRVQLTVDFNPAGRASFAAGGKREDGLVHAGLVGSDLPVEGARVDTPGALFERLRAFVEQNVTDGRVFVDERVLRPHVRDLLEEATYLMVVPVTTAEYAAACARLVSLVNEGQLRHVGSPTLTDSLKVARARPYGDGYLWSRRLSDGDASPIIAVTLAAWAAADVDPGAPSGVQIFAAPRELDVLPSHEGGLMAGYRAPLDIRERLPGLTGTD